jgi:hypothetical protein
MSATPSPKSQYLLLFRGLDWQRGLSPLEIKNLMIDWMAWSDRLVAEGKSKARNSLIGTGKIVSGRERNVSDGPYAETKEAVAGFFLLEVDSLDEAVEIARECPTLPYGLTVEVRPMRVHCLASELAAASVEEISARFVEQGTAGFEARPAQSAAAHT